MLATAYVIKTQNELGGKQKCIFQYTHRHTETPAMFVMIRHVSSYWGGQFKADEMELSFLSYDYLNKQVFRPFWKHLFSATRAHQGKSERRMEGLGVWDQQIQTVKYRMDNNKVLCTYTGNYIQYPVINHNLKLYIYV